MHGKAQTRDRENDERKRAFADRSSIRKNQSWLGEGGSRLRLAAMAEVARIPISELRGSRDLDIPVDCSTQNAPISSQWPCCMSNWIVSPAFPEPLPDGHNRGLPLRTLLDSQHVIPAALVIHNRDGPGFCVPTLANS